MATWAPGTRVIDKGLGGGPRPHVRGFIPHIGAAYSVLGFVSNPNSRNNHPTYHIDQAGRHSGIVHPDRRPWTTAHSVDNIAVTCEMDNSGLAPDYPVTQATLSTLVDLIVHHAREGGFKRVVLNRVGVDQTNEGFFVGFHRQYHAVACPGDWVWSRRQWIVDEANRRLAGKAPGAAPKPPAPPASTATAGTTATRAQWRTIQDWLRRLGRYYGPVDGVPGPNTWKGIQTTVRRYGYYHGPVDGVPGINTYKGMQMYARDGGGYRGPIDGVLGPNSWAGFVRRLSS